MTLYMTKTWGFTSPCGPLQFSLKGWRDRARAMLRPGDLVAIVGTVGPPTLEGERGKLLGLMEPTTHVVSSLDYALDKAPEDFDESGNYRWPFGLELRAAWVFPGPRRSLIDVSSRTFSMDAAQGIVEMTPSETAAILALPREPVALLQLLRAAIRIQGVEAARKRAAPPPTTTRVGIMHMRRASAFTYAMAIENASTPAFKIGWAFDYKARARQFNQAALPALGGLRYTLAFHHLWDVAMDAFQMEQWLLRRFDALRHPSNREVLSPLNREELQSAWLRYITDGRRRHPA